MRATLLTSAIAVFALSAAADPQTATKQQTAPAEQKAAVATQVQAAPTQADSPLVRAAKRSGRLGKKSGTVITNETLSKSGGHFTTTASQDPIVDSRAAAGKPRASNAPITTPSTTPKAEQKAEPKKTEAATSAKDKALKRAVADYMGESIEAVHDDPSMQEGVARQGTTPAPAAAPKPVERPAQAQRPPQ